MYDFPAVNFFFFSQPLCSSARVGIAGAVRGFQLAFALSAKAILTLAEEPHFNHRGSGKGVEKPTALHHIGLQPIGSPLQSTHLNKADSSLTEKAYCNLGILSVRTVSNFLRGPCTVVACKKKYPCQVLSEALHSGFCGIEGVVTA